MGPAVSTVTEAARTMLKIDAALQELDKCARVMVTTYAGHVSAADWLDFGQHYVDASVHRWFAEQWLFHAGEAANDSGKSPTTAPRFPGHTAGAFSTRPTQGDQPCFEHGREGIEPAVCASAAGRGENVALARATLPRYASPDGGPMGARQPTAVGPQADVTPDAARHPHADGTHRPPAPTALQHLESTPR